MAMCLSSWYTCAGGRALELPIDIVLVISEYLQSRALSCVCRKTWQLLEKQHLHMQFPARTRSHPTSPGPPLIGLPAKWLCPKSDPLLPLLATRRRSSLKSAAMFREWTAAMRTLRLSASPSDRDGVAGVLAALEAFQEAPLLEALRLGLACNAVGDSIARSMTVARGMRALQTLHLELAHSNARDADIFGLVGLRHCPALRDLHLDLSHNRITAGGARILTALRETPALQTLRVNLACNQVCAAGAQSLGVLREAKRLEVCCAAGLRSSGRCLFGCCCPPPPPPTGPKTPKISAHVEQGVYNCGLGVNRGPQKWAGWAQLSGTPALSHREASCRRR